MNARLYRQKFVEYGLLALVVIGMLFGNTGCTNVELVDGVSKSISVMVSPTGQYLFYGTTPQGQTLFAFVQERASSDTWMYAGTTNIKATIAMTADLAKAGWKVIDWSKVPGAVQLAVLTKLQEFMPLAEAVSTKLVQSPVMGMFMIPTFILDGSSNLPEGCKMNAGIMVCDL